MRCSHFLLCRLWLWEKVREGSEDFCCRQALDAVLPLEFCLWFDVFSFPNVGKKMRVKELRSVS